MARSRSDLFFFFRYTRCNGLTLIGVLAVLMRKKIAFSYPPDSYKKTIIKDKKESAYTIQLAKKTLTAHHNTND